MDSAAPTPIAVAPSREIAVLIAIMAALRTPGTGCPWDLEQTSRSILPYTIEEAQEVADAILRDDPVDLVDELGDLLLQVVFHARIAEEAGRFAFGDVVHAITSKLVRRHPHVFGDKRSLSPAEVKTLWSKIKAQEREAKRAARLQAGLSDDSDTSALAGVLPTANALSRAFKLQKKAATLGFDWDNAGLVLDKIKEEIGEIEEAMAHKQPSDVREEIGDLLFAVANLARHVDGDPEAILQQANNKFERRFRAVERALANQGVKPGAATLDEMEALWSAVKREERIEEQARIRL